MKLSLLPKLFLKQLRTELAELKHRVRLWCFGLAHDARYRAYLRVQLERTLSKRNRDPGLRARLLIDRLFELGAPAQDVAVLCIGPRNIFEIEYFRSKGLSNVVGIDLFRESPDILVMDMHQMTFPDDHFDVIYSSHSLEHAYDVHKVVSEIIRVARPGALVAIEVPVQYETRGTGTELIDFRNLQNLHAVFEPYIARVLWYDEQEPHSPSNPAGTAVLRTIFSIEKCALNKTVAHVGSVREEL